MRANGSAATRTPPPARVRRDFPALRRAYDGRPMVYLAGASTAQKPRAVIDRVRAFEAGEVANTRTPYRLGREATAHSEAARGACPGLVGPGPGVGGDARRRRADPLAAEFPDGPAAVAPPALRRSGAVRACGRELGAGR